jgi:hypothetical protein
LAWHFDEHVVGVRRGGLIRSRHRAIAMRSGCCTNPLRPDLVAARPRQPGTGRQVKKISWVYGQKRRVAAAGVSEQTNPLTTATNWPEVILFQPPQPQLIGAACQSSGLGDGFFLEKCFPFQYVLVQLLIIALRSKRCCPSWCLRVGHICVMPWQPFSP